MQEQSRMMQRALKRTGRRSGFTLIELLVVISIIGLLLGILLPSLGAAREAANSVVCQANLRSVAQGLVGFYTENNGDIAGSPATTAKDLLNDARATAGEAPEVNGLATQPFDWAGPMAFGGYLGDGSVPRYRYERFALLNGSGGLQDPEAGGSGPFSMLHCPSQRVLSAPFFGQNTGSRPVGTDEFPVTVAFSYLTSREILWGGSNSSSNPRWARETFWGGSGTYRQSSAIASSVQLPGGSGYRPNVSRLDQPSKKVYVADGTRYQEYNLKLVDHDIAADAGFGGAFSDPGPWDANFSRAYLPGKNSAGQDMTAISFRHGGGGQSELGDGAAKRGNMGFFDGHVETQRIEDARRPDFWLPSGSMVNLNSIVSQLRPEYAKRLESARGRFVRIH